MVISSGVSRVWVFVACALGLAACQFDEMGGVRGTQPDRQDRQDQPAVSDARVVLVDAAADHADGELPPGSGAPGPSVDAPSANGRADAQVDSGGDTLASDGTFDALAPDQGVDTTADQGVTTCSARYGGAAGFQLCSSTLQTCTFYVRTNENSCAVLCTGLGGKCIGGRDNAGSSRCVPSSQSSSCKWVHYDQICTCSR